MSHQVSLFSGYAQAENRTTNYCLLILRMLYEENPKFLGQVFAAIVGESLGESIGVQFRQQQRRAGSVPDGLIAQAAFSVFIETKNFDWFHDRQLEQHLEGLNQEAPGVKVLMAIANFEAAKSPTFDRIRDLCLTKYRGSIVFAQVSFEDLLEALRVDGLPKNLSDAVDDLRAYFDEENLLPSWRRWLDVVNCAGLPGDVLEGGVYMCPAIGGPYNHRRCMYFGMYRNKRVERVARIEGVVDLRAPDDAALKWSNDVPDTASLVERARQVHSQRRPGEFPVRVFLLGSLVETDFVKDTTGGMQSSKQYFDIAGLNVKGPEDLAVALSARTWSQLRGRGAV